MAAFKLELMIYLFSFSVRRVYTVSSPPSAQKALMEKPFDRSPGRAASWILQLHALSAAVCASECICSEWLSERVS